MQAHTQQEFNAAVNEGLRSADRLEDGGWLPVTGRQEDPTHSEHFSFYVNAQRVDSMGNEVGHNFKTDPWTRHALQFEGEIIPTLVVSCRGGSTNYQTYLTIAGTGTGGRDGKPRCSPGLHTRVRSLGYVGSFLREYSSAADLLAGVRSSSLLPAISAPGQHRGEGTFVPVDDAVFETSRVPLNSTQLLAVRSLSGGLDIVVGPPGEVCINASLYSCVCICRYGAVFIYWWQQALTVCAFVSRERGSIVRAPHGIYKNGRQCQLTSEIAKSDFAVIYKYCQSDLFRNSTQLLQHIHAGEFAVRQELIMAGS